MTRAGVVRRIRESIARQRAANEAPLMVLVSSRVLSIGDVERIRRAFERAHTGTGFLSAAEVDRRLRGFGSSIIVELERPRTFWALHLYEWRKAFA
jgi:hypothetical protein